MSSPAPPPPYPTTLQELVGHTDNLHEPMTTWNEPAFVIGMALGFAMLSGTFLCLRLWTRFVVTKSAGWDDYCVILILISGALGTIAMAMAPSQGGLGQHLIELGREEQMAFFKLFYIGDVAFVISTAAIKVSLLLQFLRVFRARGDGLIRRVCWALLGVAAGWGTVMTFMGLFPCFPPRAYWDWDVEARACYGYASPSVRQNYATYFSHSVITMALDVLIVLVPVPLFFRAETTRRTKLSLLGLLSIGLITNIFAALRLAETVAHRAMMSPTYDPPWYAPKLFVLGMLEVNSACVGASIPVFWRPLAERMFGGGPSIFVTREINVSVEHRDLVVDPSIAGGSSSSSSRKHHHHLHLHRSESLYSNDGSEAGRRLFDGGSSDRESGRGGGGGGGRGRGSSSGGGGGDGGSGVGGGGGGGEMHYHDTYIMEHVDPLREQRKGAVESIVTANPRPK